jgi:uncharacterized protein with GYD domain
MGTYVLYMKLTDQGARNIKEAPARIASGIKAFEAKGGKLVGFWVTMGQYDYLAVGEAPSEEVAAAFALALGAEGNVRTTTVRAFTVEEASTVLGELP